MNTKKLIRKILFVSFWLAVGGGMLTLLIAAMGRQKKDHCQDFEITLKGAGDNFFIDTKQVEKLLKSAANGDIKGQTKASLQLQKMEDLLEENVWIKDAEIYFDNKDVMHVSVTERIPVARIFTVNGNSFYMDESCNIMPLSLEQTARVPVFTGFPAKLISKRDSSLALNVRDMSMFILKNPFWMAQVSQVNIANDRTFELYPVVGTHVVKLGNGNDIERKFHRLFVFYKNVMSTTGFEKYAAIDVQFAGQIVGIRGKSGKVDSARLRYNVEKLLKQSLDLPSEEELAAKALKDQQRIAPDPQMSAVEKPAQPLEAPVEERADEPKKPKAVMGKIEN